MQRKQPPKSGLEKAIARADFIERALQRTRGKKIRLIARVARTTPEHVARIFNAIKWQMIRIPLIDVVEHQHVRRMALRHGPGKYSEQIGRLGEEFVGKLLPNAKQVNLPGIDFELPTRHGPVLIEVKTSSKRDAFAFIGVPVHMQQWTNKNCHKLVILTRQSVFILDRQDLDRFIKDFYFHHPKISTKKDILVFVKPMELAQLGYAISAPIIGIARKRKELGEILAKLRESIRKIRQQK